MGVDQAQIDKILSGASTESPDVRLDTLEKELDFLKTSIKRLLIDLRERMNELDNPFTSAATYPQRPSQPFAPPAGGADEDSLKGNLPDIAPVKPASQATGNPEQRAIPLQADRDSQNTEPLAPVLPHVSLPPGEYSVPAAPAKPSEKLKLQKVHRLFEWVHKGCRKYGQERLTNMVEAYRAMGYIPEDVSDQIREITRMAPVTRGDLQEIGPNEFVSELYVLNRILDPGDASLDRDMIEVLMLKHRISGDHDDTTSPQERDADDKWLDLLDRI
jgi:hypothetical protein